MEWWRFPIYCIAHSLFIGMPIEGKLESRARTHRGTKMINNLLYNPNGEAKRSRATPIIIAHWYTFTICARVSLTVYCQCSFFSSLWPGAVLLLLYFSLLPLPSLLLLQCLIQFIERQKESHGNNLELKMASMYLCMSCRWKQQQQQQ